MSDLIDVMPFQYQIVESASGRFRVEGVFQKSDVENANKRIYPRRIWEKELKEQRVMDAIQNRSMFGELDHPSDGKTSLKRVAHLVTGLELQEDGNVTGAAEILDTPNGQILKTLFESSAQVGISSRGSGSVNNGVVQEDFKLGTFDFVARPSTPGALPRPAGESERKVTKEEDEAVDAIVTVEDDEGVRTSNFDTFLAELDAFDARLEEETLPAGDLNSVAHDVIAVHNFVMETDITPEIIDEVSDYIMDLGGALLQLAESNPEHRTVITELLDKVEETRGVIIMNAPKEKIKEEPMDRLQFIKDRLQESQKDATARMEAEAEEYRKELNELSDEDLLAVAIETGVIDEDDPANDDNTDDSEVTVQDLLDYIEELEGNEEEAAKLIEDMAGALEEAENVDDVKLKYEAALGIIQETVSRYQLLQEAVGGEEKAYGLMETHLTTLEGEEGADDEKKDGITEDVVDNDDDKKDTEDVDTIERLLSDGPEDDKMARYKELSESALERLGASPLVS